MVHSCANAVYGNRNVVQDTNNRCNLSPGIKWLRMASLVLIDPSLQYSHNSAKHAEWGLAQLHYMQDLSC